MALNNYTYLERQDIGATLGSWLYTAMWQLYLAENLGKIGYINWPKIHVYADNWGRSPVDHQDDAAFTCCPNMFEWYFEQPCVAAPPPRTEIRIWEHDPALGTHPLNSQPVAVIKAFYQKNLRFNAAVLARAKVLSDKYRLEAGDLLGVGWRGTDSIIDGRPRMPIETFYPFIDDILARKPHLRIFARAEEMTILDPLLKRYPNAFTIDEFYTVPLGSKHVPEHMSTQTGYERGMQIALMMWAFSRCQHFVKNQFTSGMIAGWLSQGRVVCLAHSEKGDMGAFDLTKAEIDGQIVPLNR